MTKLVLDPTLKLDVIIVSKGILIVGYGTRKGNLEEVLNNQARRLRARGWDNVHIAYYRVSVPSIPDELNAMVKKGIDEIVVVPYYIAEGTLTKEFIPKKLGIESENGIVEIDGKQITIYIAPAFGVCNELTNIVCDKIADVGGEKDWGILILGHGTRHSSLSNSHIVKLNAERISNKGYKFVEYSFNEFCEPSIAEVIGRFEKYGVSKIVAVPLFVAMGLHLGDEIPQQLGIPPYSNYGKVKLNGKDVEIFYTRPVEDDPRLLDNIELKVKQYLGN